MGSMMQCLRVFAGATVVLCAGSVEIGCGIDPASGAAAQDELIAVEPHIVLDGTGALAARSEGSLIIDEVLFHAPTVELRHRGEARDLLATDPDTQEPLVFHYAARALHGRGHMLGAGRRWALGRLTETDASEIIFGFARLPLDGESELLSMANDVDLSALGGNTGVVSGWVAVPRRLDDLSGDRPQLAGAPSKEDSRHETDPETSPARPGAETDPETSPARRALAARDGPDAGLKAGRRPSVSGGATAMERVPFSLVIRRPFRLALPLAALLESQEAQGGSAPLPIDLHVDVDALFDGAQLSRLGLYVASAFDHAGNIVLEESAGASAETLGLRGTSIRIDERPRPEAPRKPR